MGQSVCCKANLAVCHECGHFQHRAHPIQGVLQYLQEFTQGIQCPVNSHQGSLLTGFPAQLGWGWFHSASEGWQGSSFANWWQSPVLRSSPSVILSKSSNLHPLIYSWHSEFCRAGEV